MNEDRWNRIELLIEQALELPPDEQVAFIQKECGTDEELLEEINSLLQYDEKAFTFIRNFSENIPRPSLADLPEGIADEHQRIDTVVGHYRITDVLGSGGMGVVYKARDTKLDRSVALKFLPSHLTRSKKDKQRFTREAKAAAALNHPNICTIHAVEEHEDQQFISMEYIDGQTLREKFDSEDVTVEAALEVGIRMAGALAEAHEKGIVHRDIKPGNIMVDAKNRIKVMDFGLAKLQSGSRLTKEGTTMGTVYYMSPEQASGKEVDHRTDIWSLGVVLYEMLTGKRPFRGAQDQAVIYSILNNRPESLSRIQSEISDEMENIVLKCLEKDPKERYQNAGELIADLHRVGTNLSGNRQDKWPNGELAVPNAGIKEKSSIVLNLFSKNSSFRSGTALAGMATGLLLLVTIGYWLFSSVRSTIPSDNTIAVLPLESTSTDPEDIQFTDGVHEELVNRLAGIGELTVIARRSVLGFPPGERDLKSIGRQLGVSSLMDGTVRRFGDQIRVSVHLIDVNSLTTLWSGSFEENIDDVFEIQSRIARQVAGELQASLTEEEQQRLNEPPTDNPRAYQNYIRAQEYFSRPVSNKENLLAADQLLNRALEEEPQFAHGWALKTVIYQYLYWYHGRTPEQFKTIEESAEQARLLAPELPETQLAVAIYLYWTETDYKRTLSYFESALLQFPNHPRLHFFIALAHRKLGNWEMVFLHLKKSLELDPLNPFRYSELAYDYWMIRDYEKAEEAANRMIELLPDVYISFLFNAMIGLSKDGTLENYETWWDRIRPSDPAIEHPGSWGGYNALKRDWDEALRGYRNMKGNVGWQDFVSYNTKDYLIARTLESKGDTVNTFDLYDQLRKQLESLCDEHPDMPRYRVALGKVYARMGEVEKAISIAEQAAELFNQHPFSQDAEMRPGMEIQLAEIYAWSGRKELAIDKLEYALSVPSAIHRNNLRVDPRWDPLREHPRFQELIAGEDEPYIESL